MTLRSSSISRIAPGDRLARIRRGFTITELLVVIGIIVLLVGLLLPALGKVRTSARITTTRATMDEFAKACEAFFQDHDRYPGLIPEPILASNPVLSGTENALFELMGGAVRGDNPAYDSATYDGWDELIVDNSVGALGRFKYNLDELGQGPIIGGRKYAPYFAPSNRQLKAVAGQGSSFGGADAGFPDLIDAWGQPIIYARRVRSIGPLCTVWDNNPAPQFVIEPMFPYTASTGLGDGALDQTISILSDDNEDRAANNLAQIIRHPAIGAPDAPQGGEARGAFALISAGKDGVYFSQFDGPGEAGDGNEVVDINDFGPTIVDEYDDILSFGGG